MEELTIEEAFERLEIRNSKLMNEKPLIDEIVTNTRKIDSNLEKFVETIIEGVKFSLARTSREYKVSDHKIKRYVQSWCEENNKQLVTISGKNGGSIVMPYD